jgi:diketogulonate reductase-like aldo/keto reductase
MLHDDIEAYCREKDIRIEAYAPLVQATRLDNPTLVQVAATHGKTVAQILLRWGIDRGYIVLPKSVHKHRIAENKQLEGWKLDEEEVVLINGLNEYQGTSWDPTVWD